MMTDTRPHNHGRLLFLALAFLVSSCRSSQPPKLSLICIGDGFGGADCVDGGGAKVYKSPSELKNYWMTTEVDMQNFASWCYDTNPKVTQSQMKYYRMASKE